MNSTHNKNRAADYAYSKGFIRKLANQYIPPYSYNAAKQGYGDSWRYKGAPLQLKQLQDLGFDPRYISQVNSYSPQKPTLGQRISAYFGADYSDIARMQQLNLLWGKAQSALRNIHVGAGHDGYDQYVKTLQDMQNRWKFKLFTSLLNNLGVRGKEQEGISTIHLNDGRVLRNPYMALQAYREQSAKQQEAQQLAQQQAQLKQRAEEVVTKDKGAAASIMQEARAKQRQQQSILSKAAPNTVGGVPVSDRQVQNNVPGNYADTRSGAYDNNGAQLYTEQFNSPDNLYADQPPVHMPGGPHNQSIYTGRKQGPAQRDYAAMNATEAAISGQGPGIERNDTQRIQQPNQQLRENVAQPTSLNDSRVNPSTLAHMKDLDLRMIARYQSGILALQAQKAVKARLLRNQFQQGIKNNNIAQGTNVTAATKGSNPWDAQYEQRKRHFSDGTAYYAKTTVKSALQARRLYAKKLHAMAGQSGTYSTGRHMNQFLKDHIASGGRYESDEQMMNAFNQWGAKNKAYQTAATKHKNAQPRKHVQLNLDNKGTYTMAPTPPPVQKPTVRPVKGKPVGTSTKPPAIVRRGKPPVG